MKERKEEELEKHSFNAEIIEDPSIGVNMVSFYIEDNFSQGHRKEPNWCIRDFLIVLLISDYLR